MSLPSNSLCRPRLRLVACAVLALMAWVSPMRAANLFSNSSFENGTWGGSQTFVDPSNATSLFNSTSTITGWSTVTGSTWVQDATRTTDGNRMLWLGPPTAGSWTCISQKVSAFSSGDPSLQLVSGSRYTLSVDYSLFAPSDPTASLPGLSTFTVYYVLGTNSFGDDPFSQHTMFTDVDAVSDWSSLQWNQLDIVFDMPSITGYDYIKFFLSAPKADAFTQSRGVLIDNAMLDYTPLAIPEPGSLIMALAAMGLCARRRR